MTVTTNSQGGRTSMTVSRGLGASTEPLSAVYDLALCDLDGVVYRGDQAITAAPAAVEAARARGMAVLFVTNNASREPEVVADHLTRIGVHTTAAQVLTAAQAAARSLHSRLRPGAKVLVVGAAGLLTAVREEGFVPVARADEHPEAVVQGFGPDVSWRELAEAAYAVAAGAWYVASNLDGSLPTDRGFAPGNGALVGAVVMATGIRPHSTGKPAPDMYRIGVAQYGAQRPLVIGDRLDTDLAGAVSGGFDSLLVLTGVNTARDAVLCAVDQRPTYLGLDLGAANEPHPAVTQVGSVWSCREARAEIVDSKLVTAGAGLDVVRAACGAVWAAVDARETVIEDSVSQFDI